MCFSCILQNPRKRPATEEPDTSGETQMDKIFQELEAMKKQLSDQEKRLVEHGSKFDAQAKEIVDLKAEIQQMQTRVQRNEAHSRSRNLRFYGFDKAKVQATEFKERGAIKSIMTDGLKLTDKNRINSVMANLDIVHWTDHGKCLIVAFVRRSDMSLFKSNRKNLSGWKPHGKSISMEDDLIVEHRNIKKKCVAALKEMQKKPEHKDAKLYNYKSIKSKGTVKDYDKWDVEENEVLADA